MNHKTVPVDPEEVLRIARMAEDLKQECGSDPESAQAVRNTQYMAISYALRAMLQAAPPSPVTELEAKLRSALWDIKNTAISLADAQVIALEALAAYEAKKEGK